MPRALDHDGVALERDPQVERHLVGLRLVAGGERERCVDADRCRSAGIVEALGGCSLAAEAVTNSIAIGCGFEVRSAMALGLGVPSHSQPATCSAATNASVVATRRVGRARGASQRSGVRQTIVGGDTGSRAPGMCIGLTFHASPNLPLAVRKPCDPSYPVIERQRE